MKPKVSLERLAARLEACVEQLRQLRTEHERVSEEVRSVQDHARGEGDDLAPDR